MSKVTIEVRDTASGQVVFPAQDLTLPVQFGRSGDVQYGRFLDGDGGKIGFGRDYSALSRQHLAIGEEAGQIVLVDNSTNGVALISSGSRDPIGKGGSKVLPRATTSNFETCGLTFSIAPQSSNTRPADASGMKASYLSNSGTRKELALSERAIAIILQGTEPRMAALDGQSAAQAQRTLAQSGDRWAVILGTSNGAMVAISAEGVADHVSINRDPTAGRTQVLSHFDTVEVSGLALQMLDPDGPAGLECTNRECRQLNPYNPTDNCRYCGTKLGESKTVMLKRKG